MIEALVRICPAFLVGRQRGKEEGPYPAGLLFVSDGDLLEASLRPTEDITPAEAAATGGDSSEDQDDDDPDIMRAARPPRGPGPFGPPPPSPVNRPRSRTPPGHTVHANSAGPLNACGTGYLRPHSTSSQPPS